MPQLLPGRHAPNRGVKCRSRKGAFSARVLGFDCILAPAPELVAGRQSRISRPDDVIPGFGTASISDVCLRYLRLKRVSGDSFSVSDWVVGGSLEGTACCVLVNVATSAMVGGERGPRSSTAVISKRFLRARQRPVLKMAPR
jgi:hypothetical protein